MKTSNTETARRADCLGKAEDGRNRQFVGNFKRVRKRRRGENNRFCRNACCRCDSGVCKKYKLKLEFKIASARYEDIYEFCEELRDNKEELAEGLEEINKAGEEGDYAEIFEELIDLAKEELIKH